MQRKILAAMVVIVCLMTGISCKDLGSVVPPPTQLPSLVSFRNEIQPIFTTSCVNAGCHPGGGAPFSLTANVSHGNLVDVNMVNSACGGKRVLAGDANASGIIKKFEGNCGTRMPLNRAPLSQAQIDLIRDWINQGAPNN